MEILLIAAIAVVAVAALYVAATFDLRAKQNTAPLIDEAVRKISDQMRATEESMRHQLQALADDLQRDREQQRLDGRKIQGRLDHADSRVGSMANQFLADLDAIKRRTDQAGAQQDQLAAGLRQLGQRVARLSEALGHPAAPAAGPGQPGPEPAVPGRLYAERIRFSLARQAPAEAGVRIQVERSVAELPPGRLGDLGDASAITDRAENDKGFRHRLGEAASDYVAAEWGDPAFAAITDRWVTQNTFPETAAAEVCDRIGSRLNVIVAKPLDTLATDIRLPGIATVPVAGIGADLILQPVTEPLGQAAEFFEIVGVVVGVATGLQPLTLAAAKMLAHDKFHDLLARGVREAASRVFRGPQAAAQTPDLRVVDQAPRIAAAPVPTQPNPAELSPTQPNPTEPNQAQPSPAQPTPPGPTRPRPPLTVWEPLPQPRSPEPGPPEPGPPDWPPRPGRPGPGPG